MSKVRERTLSPDDLYIVLSWVDPPPEVVEHEINVYAKEGYRLMQPALVVETIAHARWPTSSRVWAVMMRCSPRYEG